jgi:hypothetical protein
LIARELPNNPLSIGDVCIIGAGARKALVFALEWLFSPF